MRSLDFGTPKHVVKSVFYEVLISMKVCVCVHVYTCVCSWGRRGVEILIVLSSAGEGNVKKAIGGISCKCNV